MERFEVGNNAPLPGTDWERQFTRDVCAAHRSNVTNLKLPSEAWRWNRVV